jgi:hypothetical protein
MDSIDELLASKRIRPGTLGDMVDLMDRMRRNRNRATYGAAGTIHTKQAQDACAIADRYVEALAAIARS